jgi:excisionase family DNA binding protein
MTSFSRKDPSVRPSNKMSRKRSRRDVPRLAFNQQEAAEALGISVDHFERHVKANLPVVYSGSLRLYPRSALERWLEQQTIRGGRRVA